MKVVFAGPSLYGTDRIWPDIVIRAPASHGDIAAVVLEGASVIGLVDGCYETVAAAWHKEILFALSRGVEVFGAASIGALRGAECHVFGMKTVGRIASWFIEGTLVDDDEVALVHAPEELGFRPLTIAMVDIRATVEVLELQEIVSRQEAENLLSHAKRLHFKQRTVKEIINALPAGRRSTVEAAFFHSGISQKLRDAEALVDAVSACGSWPTPHDWQMSEPQTWRQALRKVTPR